MRDERIARASLTVEASIILSIVLLVVLACVMLGFNMYQENIHVIKKIITWLDFDAIGEFRRSG